MIYRPIYRPLAVDSTVLTTNLYSSTSAGLSATSEGDYFSVPSAESDEYLILYRHDAGPVATEVKRYPSAEAVIPSVDNIASLRDITGNNGRDYLHVKFHTSDGDGGGGNFYWADDEAPGTYVDNNGTIIVPTGGDGSAAWVRESGGVQADIVLAVPSIFPTPQEAIDYIRNIRPLYGAQFTILLESGYQLPPGTLDIGDGRYATFMCVDGDFSHIQITSEDAVVSVTSDYPSNCSIVRNVSAKGIVLNCLIDAGGRGENGYSAEEGSTGKVIVRAGVINSPGIGLYARANSKIHAASEADGRWTPAAGSFGGVIFTGCRIGCYTNHTATAYVRGGDFSGASENAIFAQHIGTIDADNCIVDGSAYGFYAREGSTINANGSQAIGCGVPAYAARGSNIIAHLGVDWSGATGTYAVYATDASTVTCPSANLSGATTYGILADEASTVNADSANISGCGGRGISAMKGSTVNASGASVNDCGGTLGAVVADTTSTINFQTGTVTGAAASGCMALNGGRINARSVDAANAGEYGFRVSSGGTIFSLSATAAGAVSGARSQTSNTITGNGIIFQ